MVEEKKYVIVAMPVDLKKEIEELVSPGSLGAFITEAVERELKRRNQATLKFEQIQTQTRVYIN
jgi:hypothetical protein